MSGPVYDLGFIPPDAFSSSNGQQNHHHHHHLSSSLSSPLDPEEFTRCSHCGFGGCDVRVSECGCAAHARCMPLNNAGTIQICPYCKKPCTGLDLFPMSFHEIDGAQGASQTMPNLKQGAKGRKRKGESLFEANAATAAAGMTSERRTGRWTNEEMALCDRLMEKFEVGELPVSDGTKLNEFLGNMLKSKQSRLTKKMKNAKLSTKLYKHTSGYLVYEDARHFSETEDCFFQSILDHQERAEIKFHMQKEWREQFSRICSSLGQPLDADSWLNSVEEMDRRASKARDAARMTRRKLMMGVAMHNDIKNIPSGVFIDKTESDVRVVGAVEGASGGDDKDIEKEMLNALANDLSFGQYLDASEQSSLLHSAPFLAKVTSYMQRHNVPFEHVDLWVPSFVPGEASEGQQDTTCRLCYAGNSTTDKVVIDQGNNKRPLSPDEQFNIYSFGDYSQKFSFNIGSGLPGRVYECGRPIWELSVDKAPHHLFERCGGASQWGIKSVVGLPIASPNVGRIVVVLYSLEDRVEDEDLVSRLSDELTRLMPAPKWKLVVDIGEAEDTHVFGSGASVGGSSIGQSSFDAPASGTKTAESSEPVFSSSAAPLKIGKLKDTRADEVLLLLAKYMPSDVMSSVSPYVSGFMSLRLLLMRSTRSAEEHELVSTMLDSYSSYSSGGRDESDIAVMLARDFLYLTQQQLPVSSQSVTNGSRKEASGPNAATANSIPGLSLFGQPSIRSSLENTPALIPITAEENFEPLSLFLIDEIDTTTSIISF